MVATTHSKLYSMKLTKKFTRFGLGQEITHNLVIDKKKISGRVPKDENWLWWHNAAGSAAAENLL